MPVVPPLHNTSVPVAAAVKAAGWVIVTVDTEVQPKASVTVTVQVPFVKPVAVEVVCAGAGSFHK